MTPKPSADGRPDEGTVALQYPCGEPPASGHGREIVPGVRWRLAPSTSERSEEHTLNSSH